MLHIYMCILKVFLVVTLNGSLPFTSLNLFVYKKAIGFLKKMFCMSPAY